MKEFNGVLQQAIHEIDGMRRELEVLRAIRDTVYAFKGAVEAPGRSGYGKGEDIAYRLREVIKEIDRRDAIKNEEKIQKPRPTIAELDAILQSNEDKGITILPNGEVRVTA